MPILGTKCIGRTKTWTRDKALTPGSNSALIVPIEVQPCHHAANCIRTDCVQLVKQCDQIVGEIPVKVSYSLLEALVGYDSFQVCSNRVRDELLRRLLQFFSIVSSCLRHCCRSRRREGLLPEGSHLQLLHHSQHVLGEGATHGQQATDNQQDLAVAQHAVSQALVEEVVVVCQDVVDGRCRAEIALQNKPVGLEDLERHVVHEVLDKVEHSLEKSKGWGRPGGKNHTDEV